VKRRENRGAISAGVDARSDEDVMADRVTEAAHPALDHRRVVTSDGGVTRT